MTTETTDLMETEGWIRRYIYEMELKAHLGPSPVHLEAIRVKAGDLVAETSRQLKALGKS